ncbi:MAG: GNAT family N-acetyltransferase, partial [Lancefieldella parvula]|nr:GNAT family N-acetyltransferase [Lancefieldella parvula]
MQLVIKRFGQLTAKELYQILSLRAETFIVDQQIMYNDLDNVDQVSTHVFYQDTDSVAAYLRIIDAGQSYNSPLIGRVCVSNKGAGIGSKLLHDTLDYLAQESSASKVLVESQLRAQPFYERAGFTQVSSKVLDHFGVLHHVLSFDLDAYRQTRNTISIDDIHVSIRPLETADLRTLQKLSVETFVDTFIDSNTADDLASCIDSLYNTEKLTRELAAKHSYFYFVEVEGQVAGYLKLNTRYEQTEGQRDDSLEIERLYILPRYKG